MRRYTRGLRVKLDVGLADGLDRLSRELGIPKSLMVRYAVQPFSWRELAPGRRLDAMPVVREDRVYGDPPRRRWLSVMLTDDEWEVVARAAWKAGVSRSTYVRDRVADFLGREPANEVRNLRDGDMRSNARHLLDDLAAHAGD